MGFVHPKGMQMQDVLHFHPVPRHGTHIHLAHAHLQRRFLPGFGGKNGVERLFQGNADWHIAVVGHIQQGGFHHAIRMQLCPFLFRPQQNGASKAQQHRFHPGAALGQYQGQLAAFCCLFVNGA